MAARYSYSNPYQVDDLAMYQYQQQVMMMQSGPRRFFSAIGRFLYRLIVLTLIVAAVAGVLFVLYRTDVLLQIARGAGIETQYLGFEKAVGAKSWGPRSVEAPADIAAAVAPASQAAAGTNPAESGETVRAAVESEAKAATADGVAIVSFDSLPTAPKKGEVEEASAPVEPAKPARSEPMTIARAAAAGQSRPAPKSKAPKAEKAAKPTELTRSIPLPKAPPKPEPVAKAEPKPEPPPPKAAPEEDHTAPRAGDNPLKAAIRASMAGKKPE